MSKALALVLAVMMVLSVGTIGAATAEGEYFNAELTLVIDAEETAAHSMHRGLLAEVPCETVNTVTLTDDGAYVWEKTLQSVDGAEISCNYVFTGTYQFDKKGRVELNPAETCTYEENYGSYDGASPVDLIHNRAGNAESDPESLEYFNTPYVVWNGNLKAKIKPDVENGTFAVVDQNDAWE